MKQEKLFGDSEGARADILRAIVVFLHATFEVVLRSHIPKPNRSLSFYSRTDLEKALKLSGVDAKPFNVLFPPLTQMAKRRKRIVHEADLSDGVAHRWGLADDWQLIMWLLAVPAFHYQLLMSLHSANVVECAMYEKLRASMLSHVKFGNQLATFQNVSPELNRPGNSGDSVVLVRPPWPTLPVDDNTPVPTPLVARNRSAPVTDGD